MSRRGSRTEGRATDQDRPAAEYVTDPAPPDAPVVTCRCGCRYRDYDGSKRAHHTVHGHWPSEAQDGG